MALKFNFFQAEVCIRDLTVTGVQTCALPILLRQRAEGSEARAQREHHVRLRDQLHGGLRALITQRAGGQGVGGRERVVVQVTDRKSTRLNSSHSQISYAVFCLKKKKKKDEKIN